MSKMDIKSRTIFEEKVNIPTKKPKKQPQTNQQLTLPKNEVAEENQIYVSQLQELARVFSSSGDRHIRQYIINLAKGTIERANDYTKIEAYIAEMLS